MNAVDAAWQAGEATGWPGDAVMAYAAAVLGLRGALTWWLLPNRLLGDRTPAYVCAEGDGAAVAGCLRAMAEGVTT